MSALAEVRGGGRRPVPPVVDRVLSWELIWVVPAVALVDVPGLMAPLRWLGWALLLAAWPLRLWYGRRRPTLLDGPIALFAAGLLVGMYASVDYRLSWEALLSFGAAILLFYAIINQTSPRYVVTITVLGVAVGFAAIPWVFGQGQIPPNKLLAYNQWAVDLAARLFPRVGPYSPHMNGLAGGLGAVIPLVGGVFLCARSVWLRLGSGLALFLLLSTVLMSGSRGGWIGLGAAIFALAVLRFRWLLLLLPLAAVAAYTMLSTGAFETGDLLSVTSGQTLIGRSEVWRTSFDMLAEVPFTGVGLASYPLVYAFYTPPSLPVGVTNPHNALLQVYSDTGLLGTVSVLWGIVVLAGMAFRLSRQPRIDAFYGLAIGLAASLAGQMAYGVFESAVTIVFLDQEGSYHSVASPVIPLLVGLFVSTAALVRDRTAGSTGGEGQGPPPKDRAEEAFSSAPSGDTAAGG